MGVSFYYSQIRAFTLSLPRFTLNQPNNYEHDDELHNTIEQEGSIICLLEQPQEFNDMMIASHHYLYPRPEHTP